jgi:hypothetical protein
VCNSPLVTGVQPIQASPLSCVQDLRLRLSYRLSDFVVLSPCSFPLWVSPLSKVLSLRFCSQPHLPKGEISHAPKRRTPCLHLSAHTALQLSHQVYQIGLCAFRVSFLLYGTHLLPFVLSQALPWAFGYYGSSVAMSLSTFRRSRICAYETFSVL